MEDGSLITPMALAHPLYPIKSRLRNKRRNLRVDDVYPPYGISSGPETKN